MLTKRFFLFFILCIILALLGVQWQICLTLSKVGVSLLAVLAAIDCIFLLIASFRLKVERVHKNIFSLNQYNEVKLSLDIMLPEMFKRQVLAETYDDLPESFSSSRANDGFHGFGSFPYGVIPQKRGAYKIRLTRCFLRSRLLGLVEVRRFFKNASDVKVYPSFHNLEKLEITASTQEKAGPKRQRKPGNSTAFDQIRPYIYGDDVRTINWRASARAASLMVNTYTDERSQPIIPILCGAPSMQNATDGISLLDRAASAAVALSASAVRHYDEAGLITLSQRGVEKYIAPERSPSTVAKLLEQTYKFGVEPSEEELVFIEDKDVYPDDMSEEEVDKIREKILVYDAEPDFDALAAYVNRWISRRSLLVLFANFENITVARHIMPNLLRISKKHSLIVVLFENDGVKETAQGGDSGSRKMSSKLSEMRFRTLCNEYLEQQMLLVDYLQKHGINVILTQPQNLTTAVLQKYLEMKSRAAI